jgi:hypothetical protein
VGDILFASTTTALSKLADVATGSALISGGIGVAPSYGKIGLTTHVSGTLPVANGGTGITSLGAGVATFLATPTSANLLAAVTNETGTGALVFATSPTLVTPALGTPSSGVVTNLTGTASININGTVGATTPAAGAFTTLNTSGAVVFNEAGANVDFRVEGDTNANLLFVDASADNVGIGTATPGFKLEVNGSFAATTKSFIIDHPTKPGMKLRYGSLESPYHGVRLTGEAIIAGKSRKVNLPDYIRGLCKQEGSQVQITNKKHGKVLWIEEINVDKNYFIVGCDLAFFDKKEYEFYWSFTAIRKDIEELVVEI